PFSVSGESAAAAIPSLFPSSAIQQRERSRFRRLNIFVQSTFSHRRANRRFLFPAISKILRPFHFLSNSRPLAVVEKIASANFVAGRACAVRRRHSCAQSSPANSKMPFPNRISARCARRAQRLVALV